MNLYSQLQKLIRPVTKNDRDFLYHQIMNPEKCYKFGTASKFKTSGFSIPLVLNKLGFQENTIDVAPISYNFKRDVLGCSNFDRKDFVLSPYLKQWKVTMFHELGHLFFAHTVSILDKVFNPSLLSVIEVEAETFSYLCARKLRIRQTTEMVGLALNHYKRCGVELNQQWFDKIDKKSDEFLNLGA